MKKNLNYYMNLPYKVDIIPEASNEGYTAVIPELPGCVTSADTIQNLWIMLKEAKELWFEIAIEDGEYIPEPSPIDIEEYSGKFVARLPKSLHRQLALRSERENTSLNQLVVMILSEGMGRWSASQTHVNEYTKILRAYTTYAQFNLSSIYQKFEDLFVQTKPSHEEPILWDMNSLSVSVKNRTRISNHG